MTIVRRTRAAAIAAAAILFPAVLSQVARPQTADAVRTWTDSSGRYRTEASFVRLEGETVYLKLVDGRVISLPLSRLSEADREQVTALASRSAPGVAKDAGVLPQLRAASVVVWQQQGERSLPAAGLVVYKEGDRGFVLMEGGSPRYSSGGWEETSCHIAVGDAGPAQRVPGEWAAERWGGSRSLLVAAADRLPAPIPSQDFAIPVEGQSLIVIGFETSSAVPPSVTRYQQMGTVQRVFRFLDGKVANIRVELPEPPPPLSVAADERGRFVGVVVSQTTRRLPTHLVPADQPERLFMVCPAAAFFVDSKQPYQKHVSFALKGQEGETRTFQFAVFASDPFEQISNPRLYIRPRTRSADFNVPLAAGDPRLIETDIPPLQMVRRRPDENLAKVLAGNVSHGRHTTFVADLETTASNDPEFEGFFAQFVFQTPDGETHYGTTLAISQSRLRPGPSPPGRN
ncbi:MAG TPA: SHD1 domain-containing protein [Thermoguttaceae bacterium]|nr:SHD1 domain-containing protein [Thermoguttaceae bacterium]